MDKKRKQKILFLINTMGRAGAERCLINLLNSMDYDKCQVSFYAVIGMGELFGEVPAQVRILNEEPDPSSVFGRQGRRKLRKLMVKRLCSRHNWFRYGKGIVKALVFQLKAGRVDGKKLLWKFLADTAAAQEETYDLAIAYIQGAATWYLAERVRASKKAAFVHNDLTASGYDMEEEAVAYRKMDQIFCVSETVQRSLLEAIPDLKNRTEVFHNILDEEGIRQRSEERQGLSLRWKSGAEGIRLLTTGRLCRVKGYDLAIRAMALLCDRMENVRWYVLGEGEERGRLEKLIRSFGLEEKFILLGAVENPYPYFAECDLYVHTSRWEGYCTAISEAILLGKPVVATDCAANREQLRRNQWGLLAKMTPESIAERITVALEDADKAEDLAWKMRQGAERRAREKEKNLEKLYALAEEGWKREAE